MVSADHSGGNPDDPVAIQFQNSAARFVTKAMTSRTVLPIVFLHPNEHSCALTIATGFECTTL